MARRVAQIPWDLSNLVEQVRGVCVIDPVRGCWLWSYGDVIHEDRYPEIMINRERDNVSRWLLQVVTGEVGQVARHTCDRPPCCNPEHLLWGTPADNVADAFERGRRAPRKTPEPKERAPESFARGIAHGRAVLTEDDVRSIRARYSPRKYGMHRLAVEYGVTKRTIQQIVRRKTWTHL